MFIVLRTRTGPRRFMLRRAHWCAALGLLFGLALAAAAGGFFAGRGYSSHVLVSRVYAMQGQLTRQSAKLEKLRQHSQAGVNAVASRMATLDARLNRLDAMGAQIVSMAGLEESGFDFTAVPGEGGPYPTNEEPWKLPDLSAATAALGQRIWQERSELAALEAMLLHRQYNAQTVPSGKPVGSGGWISSGYGWRTDPFTGERSFHPGIDFAGHEGDPVHAIAAGVVTWAGPRYGYGRLVIINDGGGYTTWYGHSEKILVQVGDVVQRGEAIALLGDTGRSTGPHVHLEVHHDGDTVNPWPYVQGKRNR
ncbi:MAG: M23 family metallopeptidase [Gammaproteobacteria bacterium]|nr:M23 family metallopeptidase [Gammaproteobacteria bacterium]